MHLFYAEFLNLRIHEYIVYKLFQASLYITIKIINWCFYKITINSIVYNYEINQNHF